MQTQLHISYGNTFDVNASNFRTVANEPYEGFDVPSIFCKPYGGLWTSSLRSDGKSHWADFWEEVYEGNETCFVHLTPSPKARIFTVNNIEDTHYLMENYPLMVGDCKLENCIDYEKIGMDFDAIHLTSECLRELKIQSLYDNPLWFWDVESTLWLHWAFDNVEITESKLNRGWSYFAEGTYKNSRGFLLG